MRLPLALRVPPVLRVLVLRVPPVLRVPLVLVLRVPPVLRVPLVLVLRVPLVLPPPEAPLPVLPPLVLLLPLGGWERLPLGG